MSDTYADILEKEFQDYIYSNQEIQIGISELLFNDSYNNQFVFEKEVEYINGITSDFTITDGKLNLFSTIECKRADIGVTEFVRGIGQLFQYEYFFEKRVSPKKFTEYRYVDNQKYVTAIVIPSDFYKNTNLNIGKFKYPESTKVIEVNLVSNNVRELERSMLEELAEKDANTFSISPYYLRDNRIFEYYILLKYIEFWMVINQDSSEKLSRTKAEIHLKKVETVNNGNWRNAFITLSTLGFIDNKNHLTTSGKKMANMSLVDFTFTLYNGYINSYLKVLIDLLTKNIDEPSQKVCLSNKQIVEQIRDEYNGKDILYLSESDGRYISSWLNIMRDDFGCIDFESRNKERIIKYDPEDLTNEELLDKISKQTMGKKYYDKFKELLKNGEFNK
ncbi:TPA: hypothetical protein U1352_001722 [Streptococcus suis]|nr:hypothetical protein [Streptococcus suis]